LNFELLVNAYEFYKVRGFPWLSPDEKPRQYNEADNAEAIE